LRGCEAEFLLAIQQHHPSREARAEHADAVENDERVAAVEIVGCPSLQ
jgi:hypothetical protein